MGLKDGQEKAYSIREGWCHQISFEGTRTQGIPFTTGMPTLIGANMLVTEKWSLARVFNIEECNADPFSKEVVIEDLSRQEEVGGNLEVN